MRQRTVSSRSPESVSLTMPWIPHSTSMIRQWLLQHQDSWAWTWTRGPSTGEREGIGLDTSSRAWGRSSSGPGNTAQVAALQHMRRELGWDKRRTSQPLGRSRGLAQWRWAISPCKATRRRVGCTRGWGIRSRSGFESQPYGIGELQRLARTVSRVH